MYEVTLIGIDLGKHSFLFLSWMNSDPAAEHRSRR